MRRDHDRLAPGRRAALGFGLLALVYLWPLTLRPDYVPFAPASQFSDLLIAHLPNAAYVRDSLARYGQLPLWNAQILAGQPFAADPLAGLWYPPNWLLFVPLLPLPTAFNLLMAAHLAWAGYGLYLYLVRCGLAPGAAMLGGAAFAGTPKLIAHLGAGHVSLVFAVAWTPWLLLGIDSAARQGGLRRGAWAGAVLALIFLADVRWTVYAGALGAALWVAHSWRARNALRQSAAAAGACLVQAGLLAAVLALPLAEFVQHSRRSALTLAEAGALSLPPLYLAGLLIPDLGGFHEWMTYAGFVPLILAGVGIGRRTAFWAAVVVLSAAFSLGTNFVLFPALFGLVPGLGLLRVPPRAWFLAALGLCVLAAHGLQRLVDDVLPLLPRALSRLPAAGLIGALTVLTIADLLRVNATLLTARPVPPRAPAAEWIAAQPGVFRVYSPSYSLPLGDGLQHVDGVDPLQLAAAGDYIETAIGVRSAGYSVTVPAFASGDLATANADALPDADRLGALNVMYLAAEFPLGSPGIELVRRFGDTRVFLNAQYRPRAWMDGGGPAELLAWSPNRIDVRADGPGLLVLSEVAYPGWTAWVDGLRAPVETVEGVFRGVRLADGAHSVVVEFRPRSLGWGAGLTLLGLAAWLLIGRWSR